MTTKPNYNNIEIFPTLVWLINLDWKFNKQERQVFKDSLLNTKKNTGNLRSNNTYILNEEPLLDFKEHLLFHIENYFDYVYKPRSTIKPYITQSWINLNKQFMFHPDHNHANSWMSAVYYYSAQEDDTIQFYSNGNGGFEGIRGQLKLEPKEWGRYNSYSWDVPVKTGDLIIFPSSLNHGVAPKQIKGDRISLAFNTFLSGKFGNQENLTELCLP